MCGTEQSALASTSSFAARRGDANSYVLCFMWASGAVSGLGSPCDKKAPLSFELSGAIAWTDADLTNISVVGETLAYFVGIWFARIRNPIALLQIFFWISQVTSSVPAPAWP